MSKDNSQKRDSKQLMLTQRTSFSKIHIKQVKQGPHLLFQSIYSFDWRKKAFVHSLYISWFSSLMSPLASFKPIWQHGRFTTWREEIKKKCKETGRNTLKGWEAHRRHKLGTLNTGKHKYLHTFLCSQNNFFLTIKKTVKYFIPTQVTWNKSLAFGFLN